MRVDHDTDDSLVASLVKAARAHVEVYTSTLLVSQAVTLRAEAWPELALLPVAPVSDIASIGYVDAAGASQTLGASVYEERLHGLMPGVVLAYGQAWPAIRPGSLITVTATAGYGSAGSQPEDILTAIKLLAAHWYEHREAVMVGQSPVELPLGVAALLENHRRYLVP